MSIYQTKKKIKNNYGKKHKTIFFLYKSRIWNLELEQIKSANVRSYTFNNEALIKEFWKLDDKKPVVLFDGKSAKDRDKFLRFTDIRITKDNYNTFYTKNVQIDTIIQPVYSDNNLIYRCLVNYLGVSKYYHESRDINFLRYFNSFKVKPNLKVETNIYLYTIKERNRINIYAADLDCVFPEKY